MKANFIPRNERIGASLSTDFCLLFARMAARVILTLGLAVCVAWTAFLGYALVRVVEILP
jgi:hypothetical protein